SGHASFAVILGDPLACWPSALVVTSLVMVGRDRELATSGTHDGIAPDLLYPPDETFHFSFVGHDHLSESCQRVAGKISDSVWDRTSVSRSEERRVGKELRKRWVKSGYTKRGVASFRDSGPGQTSFAGILGDPLSCCPSALVGTSLVMVDRDRET